MNSPATRPAAIANATAKYLPAISLVLALGCALAVPKPAHKEKATTQSASESAASQTSTLFGQIHQVSDPANSCRIDQHGRNNVDAKHFDAESNDPGVCADLELATVCRSGEGGCQQVNPCSVNPFCEGPSIAAVLNLPTAPTLGRDIAMPD